MLVFWEYCLVYSSSKACVGFIVLVSLLLRWVIALHSYSGYNTPPVFGDFEAQRHWMEITTQLPLNQWYYNSTGNDLSYWGIDYPPLSAYVSYLYGKIASYVVPEMVDLITSHGIETVSTKLFMRLSVISADLLLYIPSILYFSWLWYARHIPERYQFLLLCLSQPGLLLIDHGHFQYNSVCLGFTILGVVFILRDQDLLGSICYCLALNFKQMGLYFAPAFTFYLLAKSIYHSPNMTRSAFRVLELGSIVIATFGVMWIPFCVFRANDQTCVGAMGQVLHRVFPIARGLFEDKVANFWCVADLFLKIRRRFDHAILLKLCIGTTILGFLVSSIDLLRRPPTKRRFLLALTNSALSFFLFSFQVHEKTILLPLLPITLLMTESTLLSTWHSVVATFSMFHLLRKDGLSMPYAVTMVAYTTGAIFPYLNKAATKSYQIHRPPGYNKDGTPGVLLQTCVLLSLSGMAVLHALELSIPTPPKYPHIYMYLFAIFSCAHFLLALVYCTYWQWTLKEKDEVNLKNKTKHD